MRASIFKCFACNTRSSVCPVEANEVWGWGNTARALTGLQDMIKEQKYMCVDKHTGKKNTAVTFLPRGGISEMCAPGPCCASQCLHSISV